MDLNTALRAIIEGKDEVGRPGRGVPPANAEAARGQAESGDVKTSAEEKKKLPLLNIPAEHQTLIVHWLKSHG